MRDRYIFGVLAFLFVCFFVIVLNGSKEEPNTYVPYPKFETVLSQEYCHGVASIKLSNSWDEKCEKLGKEYHCDLSGQDSKVQFDSYKRTLESCIVAR